MTITTGGVGPGRVGGVTGGIIQAIEGVLTEGGVRTETDEMTRGIAEEEGRVQGTETWIHKRRSTMTTIMVAGVMIMTTGRTKVKGGTKMTEGRVEVTAHPTQTLSGVMDIPDQNP